MKNNIGKSFCAVPFIEPYINTHGAYGICCIEQEQPKNHIYTVRDDIEEHWNSKQIQSVRKSMINGKLPPQCSICARQELVGKQSMRQRRNLRYFNKQEIDAENPQIKKILDSTTQEGYLKDNISKKGFLFSTGRLCQLGCISCSSTYSTFLEKEYEKLGYDPKFKDKKNPLDISKSLPQKNLDDLLYASVKKQIDSIEFLQVTGGEPFLSKKFFEFLDWLVANNYSKKITLLITTNGMNLDKEKIQVLKKFRYSIIMFSVDGYDNVDDYLRYPSVWKSKMMNFQFLKNNVDEIVFASTVYSLNVFSIHRLITFATEQKVDIHLNTLEEPNFLHIKNIPESFKAGLIEKLSIYKGTESIIRSLKQKTNIDDWKKTIDVIKDFDRIRSLSFKKIERSFSFFY